MFRRMDREEQGNTAGTRLRQRVLMGTLGFAIAAALLPVRVGVVQGGSMDPTLHSGQVVAVDRAAYRRGAPAVGDVVLFRGEHGVYVKRVYAVAGQTVHLLEKVEGEDPESTPVAPGAERRIAAHLDASSDVRLRSVRVPEGAFFALGDALNNSEDSRDFGPVPVNKIIGRVLPIGASLAGPDNEVRDVQPAHNADQTVRLASL